MDLCPQQRNAWVINQDLHLSWIALVDNTNEKNLQIGQTKLLRKPYMTRSYYTVALVTTLVNQKQQQRLTETQRTKRLTIHQNTSLQYDSPNLSQTR